MADTKDNAMMGYDALHERVGKMEDAIKGLSDAFGKMNDMPAMMDTMKSNYDTMNDALGNITNFIAELKKAYNSQDRPESKEIAAQEEMKQGIHMRKFVKDAAPSPEDVEAVVAETAKLYVTHKDELIAMGVTGFDLTPDQIKAKVLEHNKVSVPTYDAPDAAAIALRTAYDTFMVTRNVGKKDETKRSKLQDAFQDFVGSEAKRPAPAQPTEGLQVGRHKLSDDGLNLEVHNDGSITYDM